MSMTVQWVENVSHIMEYVSFGRRISILFAAYVRPFSDGYSVLEHSLFEHLSSISSLGKRL